MNSWFDGVSEHQAAEEGESQPSKSIYILLFTGCLIVCSFSSAGFRGSSWKVQWEHRRAQKGHFWIPVPYVGWAWTGCYSGFMNTHLLQGQKWVVYVKNIQRKKTYKMWNIIEKYHLRFFKMAMCSVPQHNSWLLDESAFLWNLNRASAGPLAIV